MILSTIEINTELIVKKGLTIEGDIKIATGGGGGYPTYTGEYIITPYAFRQSVLDTDNKVLTDDVTVLEIPYVETSNEYGTTVAIATE